MTRVRRISPGLTLIPDPKPSTSRSADYLAWVRERACVWCGHPGPSDPHHLPPRGGSGVGLRTDDYRCVPLCREDHDAFHSTRRLGHMDAEQTYGRLTEEIVRLLARRLAEVGA